MAEGLAEPTDADLGPAHLRLFGDVVLTVGHEPVAAFDSLRLQMLVAFLVLHRGAPQPRERLAYLLWPESTDSQARTNLRKLLHTLRQAVPRLYGCVEIGYRTLRWRVGARTTVDVAEFEDALADADTAEGAARAQALERAVGAYGGDLLPACYDDWILAERDRLRAMAVGALERLMAWAEDVEDHEAAVRHGERLLRVEPVHEETYRRLMRLRARRGERAQALRLFHACEHVLERELGMEVSPATRELYERLVRRRGEQRSAAAAPTRAGSPSRMVGRRREWEQLWELWQVSAAGRPQAAVVAGEPGIGKTRLVEELMRAAAARGAAVASARAYEAEGRLAWAPVIDWLRTAALRRRLNALPSVWLREVCRLLPELLIDNPELGEPAPVEHREQRTQLFQALAAAILGNDRPALLVLDDLQWCDSDTLEFLHFLIRRSGGSRVLVAGTARPEEVAQDQPLAAWLADLERDDLLVSVSLDRLDEQGTVALAGQLAGRGIDPEVGRLLHRDTQGNPYFVVEAVRLGLPPDRTRVSPTVQSLIQARLRQLSAPAYAITELAAVIGREFGFELLAAASDESEDVVVAALDELWRHRIIKEQGFGYDFDHDKVREVAYGMISPARRGMLHRGVARGLRELNATDPSPVSARLAVHYEQAGLLREAVVAHQTAAENALHTLAIDDAVTELERAVVLANQLPVGRDRDELELQLRQLEAVPVVIRSGYGASGAERSYEQVLVLARRLGLAPPPPALRGLALAAVMTSRLTRARELGEQLLAVEDDPAALVEGHYVMGVCSHWMGGFAAAAEHFEAALARYSPGLGAVHLARFAQDPDAICRSRLGWSLWCLGQPGRAISTVRDARTAAAAVGHPLTCAYVDWVAAILATEVGDLEWLREIVASGVSGWQVNPAFAEVFLPMFSGWVRILENDPRGLDSLQEAVAAARKETQTLFRAHGLVLLASAFLLRGLPEEAEGPLSEARAWTQERRQCYLEAEIHRLYGEVAVTRGNTDAAEASFRRALDAAVAQRSPAYELRAAWSLVRLRRDEETVARLRAAREACDDGHETADLRAAATVLATT